MIARLAAVPVTMAGPVESGEDGGVRPLAPAEADGERRTAQNIWAGIGSVTALLSVLPVCAGVDQPS